MSFWLIALDMRGRIYSMISSVLGDIHASQWRLSKVFLDCVVYCKVNCPSGKIAQDGRAETAIETLQSVVDEYVLHSACGRCQ